MGAAISLPIILDILTILTIFAIFKSEDGEDGEVGEVGIWRWTETTQQYFMDESTGISKTSERWYFYTPSRKAKFIKEGGA